MLYTITVLLITSILLTLTSWALTLKYRESVRELKERNGLYQERILSLGKRVSEQALLLKPSESGSSRLDGRPGNLNALLDKCRTARIPKRVWAQDTTIAQVAYVQGSSDTIDWLEAHSGKQLAVRNIKDT
jgi:hypothetical protein